MSVDPSVKILRWYDSEPRLLPWRAAGGEAPDPYRVWLSEIMLQQTTIAAVRPYFDRFTTRWPTVAALAAAEEAELMAAWAGLGYYARARNLLACARQVAKAKARTAPPSLRPVPADLGESLREIADPELRAVLEGLARGLGARDGTPEPQMMTIPVVGKLTR